MKIPLFVILCLAFAGRINALYWPCLSNNDCTASDSICSSEIATCQCKNFDYVFTEDYTKCLTSALLGEACSDSVQCNLMPAGASCSSGICACTDERKYVHGQCRKLNNLDASCSTELDCDYGYDRESVQCKDKVCACANGYYRRNGNICRRISMESNDACVVNEDCQELGENIACVNLKCQQKTEDNKLETTFIENPPTNVNESTIGILKKDQDIQFVPNGNPLNTLKEEFTSNSLQEKSREIAIQTSIDLLPIKSLDTTKFTTTKRNWTYDKYRYFKAPGLEDDEKTISSFTNTDEEGERELKYGSACINNGQQCLGLPHSLCTKNICFCQQGYYRKNEKCYAELGEPAASSTECEFFYDGNTKKCVCQKNFFYEPHLRGCRKPIQFHLSCTANSQCSPFGAATCKPEIPRRCTCAQFAEYDELRQLCVYKSGLGAPCQNNEGCPVENSICSKNICACNSGYFVKDNKCMPESLYATCDSDLDCNVENSECQSSSNNKTSNSNNKVCNCRKGFVHFDNDKCIKEAEDIDDPCVENEQCAPLLAKCVDKKCTCAEDEQLTYGRCNKKKELGEACSKAGECYVKKDPERVECRNSLCKCKLPYSADTTRQSCVRVAPSPKNSSGRPSALKIITFVLIGSAFLITTAALKQAYYV